MKFFRRQRKWILERAAMLEKWAIRKCDNHMHWSPIACHLGHHLRHNFWARWAFWGVLILVVLMPKTSLFTIPAIIAILTEWWGES